MRIPFFTENYSNITTCQAFLLWLGSGQMCRGEKILGTKDLRFWREKRFVLRLVLDVSAASSARAIVGSST